MISKPKTLVTILLAALLLAAGAPLCAHAAPLVSAAQIREVTYQDGKDISTTGLQWEWPNMVEKVPTSFKAGEGRVLWEPTATNDSDFVTQGTLTLENATINSSSFCIRLPSEDHNKVNMDITIVLKGENKLTSLSKSVIDLNNHPTIIRQEGDNASLTISGGDIGIWCKELTIDGVKNLSIEYFNQRGIGVRSDGESVTISDSQVTITGTGISSGGAIYFQNPGNLVVDNSKVVAMVEEGYAIGSSGNVTFTDSDIVAIGKQQYDVVCGMYGFKFTMDGGTLYVKNSDSTGYTIPADSEKCKAINGAVIYYGNSNNYRILNGDNVQWSNCDYNVTTGEITTSGFAYIFDIAWDENVDLFPFDNAIVQTRFVKLNSNGKLGRYPSTITIPKGATVTVPAGANFQNYGTIINNGILNIQGRLLNVHSSNIGAIQGSGTVNGFAIEYTSDSEEYVVNGDTVLNFNLVLGERTLQSGDKVNYLLSSKPDATLTIAEGYTLDAKTNVTQATLPNLFQTGNMDQLVVNGTLLLPEDTNIENLPEITGTGTIKIGTNSYYAVTVNEDGKGIYKENDTVTISAPTKENCTFEKWESADITIAEEDAKNNTLTFTMPSKPVTVTAKYREAHNVTVTNGSTEEPTYYYDGETVTVTADTKEGYTFEKWISEDVTFADETSATTTFVMPDKAVAVTAQFKKNETPQEPTPEDPTPEVPSKPSGGGGKHRPTRKPTTPITPTTPTPTQPPQPSTQTPRLDTQTATLASGASYGFLVKGARDPANLKVEVSDPSIASVSLVNANDPRGAYYVVTAKGTGSVLVRVTENGQTSQFSLHVTASRGSLTLDTDHYTMAPGNAYTIGAFLRDPNGEQLSSEQVQALIASGALSIRDSRTGSVVDMQLKEQGNVLLTAKNEGTCYILYDIEGQHMSVRVDVKNGVQPSGQAVRRSAYWM